MEIELIQDGGQIKRETDIYHHSQGPMSIICQLPGPPCFSLVTTFKYTYACCASVIRKIRCQSKNFNLLSFVHTFRKGFVKKTVVQEITFVLVWFLLFLFCCCVCVLRK
jgi:hypothetical protein